MASNGKPKNNPAGALVALLLLLLAAVAVIIVLRSFPSDRPQPTSAPATESAEPSAEETQTPLPSPSPTLKPSPSPTPLASPSPSPTPYPVIDKSGSFRSDTGTGLNIVVDWKAMSSGDGSVVLEVTLSAESYSMQCAAIRNGATVVINGESNTFNTGALDYDGSSISKNVLGSVSTTLPLGYGGTLSIPISATWAFKGTYSDAEIDSISADGEAAMG